MYAFLFRDLWLKSPVSKGKRRKSGKRGRTSGRRPRIEQLEDRAMMTFLVPSTLPVGTSTGGVAVGDYNADGKADMAVVDQTASKVDLMLSNGDGTFQNSGSYAAGTAAIDAVFGDFNADGKNDLAVVSTSGIVNVLLGHGVVSAADYTIWRDHLGSSVQHGTHGDSNDDGMVDANDYTSLIQQFGKVPASGAFNVPVGYAVGIGAHAINVGDFNGDGKLDIATMNSNTASVLLGNGDGTFGARSDVAIPGNSTNLVVGDFNRDGYLDMATSNTASVGTITLLNGHGDGTFAPAANVYAFSAPVYLGVGDFNHDGYDDFAVTNSYAASSMSVVMNNGDGTYAPPRTYNIPETGYEIQVGDFDNDGNDDFAVRGASEYMVELGVGDGTFLPVVNYATPSGRFEMGTHGDFNGDGAIDFAYPSTGGVTVMMNANDTVTNLAGAVGFNVTTPASTTSGSLLPMTVTIVDANGNAVPDFLGTVYITSNDAASNATFGYRFTAADAGTHTFSGSVRLVTVGTQTVTVSSPLMTSLTRSVNVTPAISRLDVSAPAASTAGDAFNVTVTAYDAAGNVGTGYTSTIHFSTADVKAGLPADYTFTSADAGVHTFTSTLKTSGRQFLNVSEVGKAVSGGAFVDVSSAAATGLQLAGGGGAIGIARPITVVGRDVFGNIATGYTGTVHITSSDPAAVLPADVTLVNGTATFNVTLMTVGTQTITAIDIGDPTFTATLSSDATPPVPAVFAVDGYPSTTAGVANSFTVAVRDTIGQIATGYTGTVYFSSSDVQAGLPASYTFTEADAGVHTFSVTLKSAGTQSISVRDLTGALVGSQMGINVAAADLAGFQMSAPLGTDSKGHMLVTAGDTIALTVKARDTFGNIIANYNGVVSFTSTDSQAGLPANYAFTAADGGVHAFAVALKTVTPNGVVWSFSVVDAANVASLSTMTNFEVTNAAAAVFVLNVPSKITAGTPFAFKVSVLDAYGNRVKNYFGTIHFSNTAGSSGLPADYSFNSVDAGDHSFTVTLGTAGLQTLTVADVADSALTRSVAVTVKA
jgi:FG-GAP-like repeat